MEVTGPCGSSTAIGDDDTSTNTHMRLNSTNEVSDTRNAQQGTMLLTNVMIFCSLADHYPYAHECLLAQLRRPHVEITDMGLEFLAT